MINLSLDRTNNDDWNWVKAKDFMIFNPRESIKKGTTVKNIPMDKIEPKTKEISSYDVTEFKGGVKFRNGDTLMARITPCLENGKISQVSILDYNEIGAGSTEFIVLREKEGISDKDFIYYLSNSEFFKEPAIKSMVGSSGRQRVQRDVVENLDIYVPPLSTQKKIGKLLSYFDDKISLNKRINQNLENIAGNIFKRYFLDYSPFQNLTFNESIIGDVPNEWNFIKIKDVVDVRDGTHDSPSAVEIGFPLITSKHLNKYDVNKKDANKISFEDYTNINKRSLVEPFDILISMIGTVGNICYIMYDEIDFAIKNVGLFKTSKNPLLREYLLLYLKSNIVTQYIDSHLAGSTQKYISLTELRNIPIVIPPKEILTDFKDIINPIFNNIKINNLEINKLINLRDILLPKLMSGEIDVSKINLNYNND